MCVKTRVGFSQANKYKHKMTDLICMSVSRFSLYEIIMNILIRLENQGIRTYNSANLNI